MKFKTIMDKRTAILGTLSKVSSYLLTFIFCLPIPILLIFFIKNSGRYFSLKDDFHDLINNKIDIDTFKKKSLYVLIRLSFLSLILIGLLTVGIILCIDEDSTMSIDILLMYFTFPILIIYICIYSLKCYNKINLNNIN